MLFIEGSRSIYDMRFQSWPATKWLLKIQKHTNGELDRLGWGLPEFCLKTSCRSYGTLYHVMCPDVLRCPYRLMMTDVYFQKKGKLKIIYIYILLCFFYSNTKTFEATLGLFCWTLCFHRRRHRRKLWWDLASLYQNGKDTEGDWMKVDGEHFKNLGLFHTGLHSYQSSFIKLLILNIFRCFSKKGPGASTMWDSKADLLQNECEKPCRQISWPLCRLALCGLSLSPWMKATNPCIKLNQKHCCSQQRTHWVKHVCFFKCGARFFLD